MNAITSGPQRTAKNISLALKRRDVMISTLREPFAFGLVFLRYFVMMKAHKAMRINAVTARIR